MIETLKYLTQVHPPRNYKNIDSLNCVAGYISERFTSMGLDTYFQTYKVEGKKYKNIIATLNPHLSRRLIIGGHYDVCGDTQGADDNASAIAGVIESAKQLQTIKEKVPFRVDFVCFTLEEPPYFGTEHMGSYVYAKYLYDNNIDVIGMINYEMIGYFSVEPNSQEYPLEIMKFIYPITGNFIANVSNEDSKVFLEAFGFDKNKNKIDSYDIVLPESLSTITASDHLNFWKFGFPAIMVTDTAHFRNKNYHTAGDTLETLDLQKMGFVIEMVVQGVLRLNSMK